MKRISWLLLAVLAFSLGVTSAQARDGLGFDDRMGTFDPGERRADNGDIVYRCGTDERGRRPVISQETIDRWIQENRFAAGGNIPVYVHVIRKSQRGQLIGDVSDADIAEQIAVLNNNYAGRDYDGTVVSGAANTGYSFTLAGVTRTTNSKWFGMTPGSKFERDAKDALSVNPGGALNIFLCGPGQNLLGWAVFPWTSAAGTSQDGVVIHYASLPNGSLAPYNLGGTATHEVGHYLGLLHTFQGGCHSDATCATAGDQVCDTPAQGTSTSGCPNGKDTCSGTGLDPIHNYMDYSYDACYTNFTNGQDTRMNAFVTQYRGWIGATRVANDGGEFGGPGNIHDEPDPIGRLDLAEFGEGKSDNGEVVYRCATQPRKKHAPIPQEQIDRWIQENRIVAGGVIPVWFHVIHNGREGNIGLTEINAQLQVMNRHFAGRDYNGNIVSGAANTGYTFVLAGWEATKNSKWFRMTPGSTAETQAKNQLVRSPGGTLNIYTCKPGQNLLGWAYFPQDAAGDNIDGVVIHYASLPGGTLAPYNLGGTATHEVGHYLGLYHTFQGGCHSDATCATAGDQVCDTPAEGTATSGCPNGKDSCTQPGLDPIHNYMDYSTDICYTNFTAGQDTKMNTVVTAYRPWIGATRFANGAGSIEAARELGAGTVNLSVRPNPFNPRTKVEFGLRKDAMVSLRVYDIHGRLAATLVDRRMTAGTHSVDFEAGSMASGIYQMVLRVEGEKALVRRITLLK